MTFYLDDALNMLLRTPHTLRTMLQHLPDGWITGTEGEGTWSPFTVVAHLAYCEHAIWPGRIQRVMDGRKEPFEQVNRTAHFEESKGKSLDDVLTEFETLRAEMVAMLRGLNLTDADLDRTGAHPALGEVTLKELLAVYVSHDLTHTAQIVRTMAGQYNTEIGAWAKRSHYGQKR